MFEDRDSMRHTAYIRLIVIKHLPQPRYTWSTSEKRSVTILDTQSFVVGVERGAYNRGSAIEELNEGNCFEVEQLMIDKPCGYYEIVGDYYCMTWKCSYEYEEYESAWEIRNDKIAEIDYHTARSYEPA